MRDSPSDCQVSQVMCLPIGRAGGTIWEGFAGIGQSGRFDGEGGIPAIEPNQRAILADRLRLSVRIAWVGGDGDGVCHQSVVEALPSSHPLPASPIKGEVSAGRWDWVGFQEWRETSPLMGEVGGGVLCASGEPISPKTNPRIPPDRAPRRGRPRWRTRRRP
jgi:hypothetical protein